MKKTQSALFAVLLVMVPVDFYLIFRVAPTEAVMGNVQRIFYLHVSLAISSYVGFGITFLASIMYLWSRRHRWDTLAYSGAEVGLLFATLVLVTGSLWARPIWGAWWTWDPRLVTVLILWFIYVGYFMLRKSISDWTKRARYSAIVGIIGFADVPIVRLATKWWRSIHPRLESKGGGLDPTMLKVLLFSLATFLLFAVYLFIFRYRLACAEERLMILKKKLED